MIKKIDSQQVIKSIENITAQKHWMFLGLIALTALFFVSDLAISREDIKNLLRNVWPSFLVIIMATLWYDRIIKNETKLESQYSRLEIEDEIISLVNNYIENEAKKIVANVVTLPEGECFLFRMVGKNFIKDKLLLEKYVDFASEQLFNQQQYYNLVAKFFLHAIPNDCTFYFMDRIETFNYNVQKSIFTIAVTDDSEIVNILLAKLDNIDYVGGVSSLSDYSVQEVSENTSLIACINKGNSRFEKNLRGKIVNSENLKILLKENNIGEKYLPKIGLIEFDISQFTGLVTFTINQKLKMRLDDHVNCWFADRLTYLDRVEFDYRGIFTLGRDFNVQHFFSSPISNFDHDDQKKIAIVEYNGWVIKGQGSILVWRDL
jgi:hypothetical protein